MRPMMPILCAFFLVSLAAGCNRSNDAAIAQAKADADVARVEAQTAKAELAKATAEVTTLRLELARLQAARPEPARPSAEDADRMAAEWVVKVGGVVRISADAVVGEYPQAGKLPDGAFRVIAVNLKVPGQKGILSDEGVKRLAGLKHLTSLTLEWGGSGSHVTDFSFLNGMTSLEVLDLHESGITDAGLAHFKGLTKLKILNLEHFFGNREITDAGLVNLKDLNDLEVFWLWGANITDTGLDNIRGLTKLKVLKLGRTPKLTDAALTRLKGMSELHELHLVETQVTNSGLETLKGLSKLILLNLEATKVTDEGLVHLKGMSKLKQLILGGTKVTDAGVADLKKSLINCQIVVK